MKSRIDVPHLGSSSTPCWPTRWTTRRTSWTTSTSCKIRRFSAVLTPDIIPKWLKWPVWAHGEGGGGVPHEEEHGGAVHGGLGGHQLGQIHSHIKVSAENSLYHVLMDIYYWTWIRIKSLRPPEHIYTQIYTFKRSVEVVFIMYLCIGITEPRWELKLSNLCLKPLGHIYTKTF